MGSAAITGHSVRGVTSTARQAFAGLLADRVLPQLLVVVDNDDVSVTLLRIETRHDGPATGGVLRLRVSENELSSDDAPARPDQLSYTAALACAQRLAGYRAGGPDAFGATPGNTSGWQDLVGIETGDNEQPTR